MQLMLFDFILKMGSKIGVSCYPAKIKKYKSWFLRFISNNL